MIHWNWYIIAKAAQPMEPKVLSVKPLVDDEDEFNPDEWQAVPAKGSKPATGSKIKDSETPEIQSESRPKKPVVREKPAEVFCNYSCEAVSWA